MKYLLISDTHGQLEKTRNLILQYPLMDGYFHMGDVGFALSYLEQSFILSEAIMTVIPVCPWNCVLH
ncbi:hypothetical protein [Longicatena caecimuris]|uniref:hypothetical protein n=1 Tax=Longicatena caecimuris TaxID=1796635 RepID=UPI001E50960D|nr:hypothetical protein [Longicatena caecimuris]